MLVAGRHGCPTSRRAPPSRRRRAAGCVIRRRAWRCCAGLLARPLASYYLLISSSGAAAADRPDDGLLGHQRAGRTPPAATPSPPLTKQAIFAVIGLVAFWVCQRLPARTYRALGRPLLLVSLALLVLLNAMVVLATLSVTATSASARSGRTCSGCHLGPIQLQPAELAKFALVLWGADVLARKGAALGWWRELATPLFPVVGAALRPGRLQRPRHHALPAGAGRRPALGGRGAAAGLRRPARWLGLLGVGLLIAAASLGAGSGAKGAENYRFERGSPPSSPRPARRSAGATAATSSARPATRSTTAAGSASAWARARSSGTGCPRRTTTSSSRVIAEELGVVGCVGGAHPVRGAGLHRAADRPPGRTTRSAGSPPPASPPGWSARR